MIELPEALTLSEELADTISGKTIVRVLPPSKEHKFCWFTGNPIEYEKNLKGKQIQSAKGFGIFAELNFADGHSLCFNDGVNVRLFSPSTSEKDLPKNYQLLIELDSKELLVFTVAMYGGIILHDNNYADAYYQKSRNAISPFDTKFRLYFDEQSSACAPSTSAKALLATEQRFPGIGNGVLQDILFAAHIHPKRKLQTLSSTEREQLRGSIVTILRQMTEAGGRDTEKDLFGNPGGYKTKMSRISFASGCPVCGGSIVKETYLGGTVYYCPHCQPL